MGTTCSTTVVLCVVNPILFLGGEKNLTGETELSCCSLYNVLRDIVFHVFVCSSCIVVKQPSQFAEHHIIGSLSKKSPLFRSSWMRFFNCSLLSVVIHALTGAAMVTCDAPKYVMQMSVLWLSITLMNRPTPILFISK